MNPEVESKPVPTFSLLKTSQNSQVLLQWGKLPTGMVAHSIQVPKEIGELIVLAVTEHAALKKTVELQTAMLLDLSQKQEIIKKQNAELLEALKWCAEHAYAGGKRFADVEPVKSALKAMEGI